MGSYLLGGHPNVHHKFPWNKNEIFMFDKHEKLQFLCGVILFNSHVKETKKRNSGIKSSDNLL